MLGPVEEPERPAPGEPPPPRRLAWSTAIFAGATGLSRILGLVREIVARNYFGVRGPINAFEIAFLIPNTVRALVADDHDDRRVRGLGLRGLAFRSLRGLCLRSPDRKRRGPERERRQRCEAGERPSAGSGEGQAGRGQWARAARGAGVREGPGR